MTISYNASDKNMIKDIIDWDVVNWKKALDYWQKNTDLTSKPLHCLELGAGGGGISLWLALNGNNVVCSDLHSPEQRAAELHKKYNCEDRIQYEAISALDIPYENTFDIVVFKSIVGGIAGDGKDEIKQQVIDQMYKVLKPGGKLLFAENLRSSFLHMYLREMKWKKRDIMWNFMHYKEIDPLLSNFKKVNYETIGFFGIFGLVEWQRNVLGKLDGLLGKIIPKSKRYIVYGIAKK